MQPPKTNIRGSELLEAGAWQRMGLEMGLRGAGELSGLAVGEGSSWGVVAGTGNGAACGQAGVWMQVQVRIAIVVTTVIVLNVCSCKCNVAGRWGGVGPFPCNR